MSSHDDPELIAPRADEQLSLKRLEPYLRERLPIADGEFLLRQFRGGHANLTYLLRFGDTEYVLRRPPLGPIAPGSHDMQREFRVLSKLHRHFSLAPECHLYCDDETILGAPFQVMERRHGIVIRNRLPPLAADGPALRRRIGEMMVSVLADLHGVDREAAGLADLGHPHNRRHVMCQFCITTTSSITCWSTHRIRPSPLPFSIGTCAPAVMR
jgi:aminoglycoside phosphotransferase (APT) family kinase protein